MPKTKISEFSATPGNNTDIDGINIAEGCAPSGINDAIRELMSQLKDFQAGTAGDSFNGPVGTTTAAAGAFTTLSSTGNTTLGDAAGDTVTVNGTATFANANPTLSAGTANGVAYLNGSKVLTTGSALTFDGTNLGIGTSSPAAKLDVSGTSRIRTDVSSATVIATATNAAANAYATYRIDSNDYQFYTTGSEKMRIDSSGNVGIGTSSPTVRTDIVGASGATRGMVLRAASDNGAYLQLTDIGSHEWYVGTPNGTSALVFGDGRNTVSDGTERMRIDSSGNLLVGTTDTSMAGLKGIRVGSGAATGAALVIAGSGAANKGFFYSSSAGVMWETVSGAVAQVLSGGTGGVSLANGATSWSAISDERHKDIIEPISNAANKVASLRAVIGKYKTDETETRRAFLIAQDVQAVLPEAVDSTDADSLALRYSDLTPLLVAAIQEQQAIINQLKAQLTSVSADVAALKGA